MVTPAMQLAGKIPDVHVQLWASSLLKGKSKLNSPPLMCRSVARGFIMLKPTKIFWRIKRYLTLLLYSSYSE